MKNSTKAMGGGHRSLKSSQKFGFTLAEVLITLAIIGVVAALTIPTVVNNYQKQAQYTAFIKFYNTMQNVMSLASVEESPTAWDYTNVGMNDFFDKHIAPYVKISSRGNVEDYFGTEPFKSLTGSDFPYTVQVMCQVFGCSDAVVTQDGLTFVIARGAHVSDNNKYVSIMFDTNGAKGPNVLGRDMFNMEWGFYTDNNTPKTYFGILDEPEEDLICDPSDTSNPDQGMGCALRLIKEGKMNY